MAKKVPLLKGAVFLFCLVHVSYLVLGVWHNSLGPNPIEVLTHATGELGLNFLLLSLLVTPLRRILHWNFLIKLRRLLGLCSFFYILLHLSIFIVFDHFFFWTSILEDIVERPYITVGFAAFLLMLPLALTSFNRVQRKMGKRWFVLHRVVYVVAILGVIHYWWLVKADIVTPMLYALAVVVLLGARFYFYYQKRH